MNSAAAPSPSTKLKRAVLVVVLSVAASRASALACIPIDLWENGKSHAICREDLVTIGATELDLGEEWVPFAVERSNTSYRQTYVALAQERFADAGLDAELAEEDRHFELFGVFPTLGVIQRRLADATRHKCHAAIVNELGSERLVEESRTRGGARIATARTLRAELEHDARTRGVEIAALAKKSTYYQRAVHRLAALDAKIAAIRTVQAHLACDGLLASRPGDGAYTWQTSNAVERFQRGVMIAPTGTVDEATRDAFGVNSDERDVRAALRVLRERVVAATGLVEDGSASDAPGTVLGRKLEPIDTLRARGRSALADGAPDLISAATDAAARALGWHDAAAILAFLEAGHASHAIAVRLPPLPSYRAGTMALSIEIDRGDVSRSRTFVPTRRPALIIYVQDGARRVPLVQWPTTIGGWQDERVDGAIVRRWKSSPVGTAEWKDLFVAPRWLPPASTPDRELVRRGAGGVVLARQQLGPSYRAAFGLAAFVHLQDGEYRGIRTHGTGNLSSLARGASHGCHRLLGMHVLRLAGFVLAHHPHAVHGPEPTYYRRTVRSGGRAFRIAIDTLGDRIELVPPIPVTVGAASR
ncbi:MAG: peptidoglycan-binding protein [Kofleriaceae bacterium]